MVEQGNTQSRPHIAVLYGGVSAEREISLLSGSAVLNAFKQIDVETIAVDVDDKQKFLQQVQDIAAQQVDKVFIALHGGEGEDGTVQAVLDMAGLPYTGSGVLASAMALDKLRSKQVWQTLNLPMPAFLMLAKDTDWQQVKETLGTKVIVKPAREGSSLGMSVAQDEESFRRACETAAQYQGDIVIEQWVEGSEYTVSIIGKQALPIIKLETDNSFYDFDAKYRSDETRYICPCGLTEQEETDMQQLGLQAFHALGCSGWGRVDFMRSVDGENFILEVNTVPGLTSHSLVPMAAKAVGADFPQMLQMILDA